MGHPTPIEWTDAQDDRWLGVIVFMLIVVGMLTLFALTQWR